MIFTICKWQYVANGKFRDFISETSQIAAKTFWDIIPLLYQIKTPNRNLLHMNFGPECKTHMWLGGCRNPSKIEQCWEHNF